MIVALLIDPDDSPDFPGNTAEVLGRPLAAYPLMAAKASGHVGRLYVQTVSPPVRRAAGQFGAVVLDAPPHAQGAENGLSDAALIVHGWRQVKEDLKREGTAAELVVLLFANSGAVSSGLIEEGIEALLKDQAPDSAATVSCWERWNPSRALRETADGKLVPYAECQPEAGTPWFPDWGAVVVRPRVLDALTPDSSPLAFLGARVLPLKQAGGGPIDHLWQVPKLEYWLKKQGVRDNKPPEPQPKLQPAPKPAPKSERR